MRFLNFYNVLYIFVLINVFASCRPEPLDLKIEHHSPRLVVSSQIIPHQTMFISLTKSFSALSNSSEDPYISEEFLSNLLVKNAFVTISYFGQTDTLEKIAPGIYGSVNTLQYEHGTYTLYARDSATGLQISATTTIKPLVKFDTIIPRLIRTSMDTVIYVDYSFKDLPGEDNWFVINYYVKQDTTNLNGANLDIANYFKQGSNKLSEFELVSDKIFVNGQYTSSKKLNYVKPTDTIAVTLSNISEGYFQFLYTYLKSGNVVNQLSGEPVNYPTNVSNGYGYFSAHYPDVKIIDLNKH